MTKHVDFAGAPFPGATQDTGTTAPSAIRPILNGEPATQTTLQRPDENLRARTEIIRTELEQLKYLSQADRALVVSLEPVTPLGTVTWNGTVAGGGGGDGRFTIAAGKRLTLRPFLAPRASTPAKILNRGLRFQTNLAVVGPINPPRAYGAANKYNVQFVNQTGSAVSVTYDPLLFRFTVNTDTTAITGRTKTDVVNAFNAAATFAGQGITATIDSGFGADIFAEGETFVQEDPADFMTFSGAADAELHEIADTTLTAFFADVDNAMAENDVLAIWYATLVADDFGGREQSIADAPESPGIADIPVGSLFLVRRFPERVHNAIPVATVVNNQLLLADGTLAPKGLATPISGGNELPPPEAALPPRMLRMNPAGTPHSWNELNDNLFVGGLQTVATTAARDLIDVTQRKEGMIVYSQADDRHFVLEGGLTNGDWKDAFDSNRVLGGLHVLTGAQTEADIPLHRQRVGMLVHKPTENALFRISVIGAPPTLAPVRIQNLDVINDLNVTADMTAATVTAPSLFTTTLSKDGVAGPLYVGSDANSDAVNIGRSGQNNQLNGDLWWVPGEIGADGGIGRVTNGPLEIGNDAAVTAINIGTAVTTGTIDIGSGFVATHVQGSLDAGAGGSNVRLGNLYLKKTGHDDVLVEIAAGKMLSAAKLGEFDSVMSRTLECHPGRIAGAPHDALIEIPPSTFNNVYFPDGAVANASFGGGSSINIENGTAFDRATGAVAQSYTVYYVFARKSGYDVNGFVYSSTPPLANGALPFGEVEGGYVSADYAYMGSLMTGDLATQSPWGGCRVVYYDNGLRRVWVSDRIYSPAAFRATASFNGLTPTGTLSLGSLNATLPTAREFELGRRLVLADSEGGTVANATITVNAPCGGAALSLATPVALTGAGLVFAMDVINVPRMTGTTDYTCSWSGAASGQKAGTVDIFINSWLEHVNHILPIAPPSHNS